MEKYFSKFRKNIVGINSEFTSPYGKKKIIYADWIASGRLYEPIEKKILEDFGPFIANTHTETSETGTLMTHAYHHSHEIIRKHVNGSDDDIIITACNGMTGVVNKLQRILGLKIQSTIIKKGDIKKTDRPVVFVTHMEHHSNHTSWYETIADVVVLPPGEDLLVDIKELERQLKLYEERKVKIGSFSACSNVTGVIPPYYELSKIMHKHGGVSFVDFAASAPYVDIDMHPADPEKKLDAVYFSPHKFLGGPGSSGVLIFNKSLYNNEAPDNPGGGTVDWTNPWGYYKYIDDIELREDGGTPGFIQSFRIALAIKLKEKMGVPNIEKREKELLKKAFEMSGNVPGMIVLAENVKARLGVFSFYIENIHYNLIVKLLSDRFGIQVRGGCACAGTYGHYLLNVTFQHSKSITDKIDKGDLSEKPGWVRLSLHPTMTDKELEFVFNSLKQITENIDKWAAEYDYSPRKNEFYYKKGEGENKKKFLKWFEF